MNTTDVNSLYNTEVNIMCSRLGLNPIDEISKALPLKKIIIFANITNVFVVCSAGIQRSVQVDVTSTPEYTQSPLSVETDSNWRNIQNGECST